VTFFDYPADNSPSLDRDDEARVKRLMAAYRTWPSGDPLKTIVIAACDAAAPLRHLTHAERDELRRAAHALAFGSVSYDYYRGYGTRSADNFLLYHQMIRSDGGTIGVESGRMLRGGLTTDDLLFMAPPWVDLHEERVASLR
jgi:hypothetical protein